MYPDIEVNSKIEFIKIIQMNDIQKMGIKEFLKEMKIISV